MSACLETRVGDSLSYAGTVTLPAGNWSAIAGFSDNRDARNVRRYHIGVGLTLVGPNASDSTRNDWTIALSAPGAATASWPRPDPLASALTFSAAIKFSDDSPIPIVKTSESFEIRILAQVL